MTIGTGILLTAIGAILRFAITADLAGIQLDVVGNILMITGVVIAVVGAVLAARNRTTTVTREGPHGQTTQRVQRDPQQPHDVSV